MPEVLHMPNLWKALLTAFLFAVEWLADRLYGDAIFARVRPIIPAAISIRRWTTCLPGFRP
jgi:hypothetical protein